MNTNIKNYFKFSPKFFLVLLACLLVRLLPLRVPNVEPILATTMPLGRAYGAFAGVFFAILSILLYDVTTGTLGAQTIFTAVAYGVLGWWSVQYFKTRQGTAGEYVRFAIIGTLFFDALTGLTVGPIFFQQSFFTAVVGQIPFTAFHLLGNIIFAFLLSPAIYKFLIKKKEKQSENPISILNPKII